MKQEHSVTRRNLLKSGLSAAAVGLVAPRAVAAAATSTAPAEASDWRVGCFTRPWGEQEWPAALDAIAEAGFKHAGLMTSKTGLVISLATSVEEASRIGAEARKRGLEIPSVYGGGFDAERSLEAGIAGLKKLIDNCAAAGAKTLMLGGTGDANRYDDYYKAVAETCDYAAEKRVGLVLKPHGGLNATGSQCAKTIKRVGHKSFTLWYDPGNIFYYSDGKLDPIEDAPSVAGIVSGMCVKDFTMTVEDGKPSKVVDVNPGDGKVDFPAVMAQLKKGGFTRGPLVIETLAPGSLPERLAAARKARLFVEALVAGKLAQDSNR